MNYTHLPLTYLRLKNNFPSLHEGHIGEEAGLLLLKGSFSQFCGVTDEEWCSSRYLWVISFGRAATHSSNNGLLGQVSRATTHDSEHFQSWICRNITVFDQPVVNHLLLVVLPTQHSRHFWYGRGSHSLHSLPFFASASFLGWKALLVFSPISLLPACSWELVACSADRWLRWPRQTTLLRCYVGGSPRRSSI